MLVTNLAPLVTRIQMSNIFDKTDLEKLNNFLFQYQLHFHTNPVQFATNTANMNFTIIYLIGVV